MAAVAGNQHDIGLHAVADFFEMAGWRSILLGADVPAADLAQDLLSYPECYLQADQVTDTRIVETIQRMQETLLGRADHSIPLRAVMQCGEAIVVPSERAPRGQPDPLMDQLRDRLSSMIAALSLEARRIADT